MTPRAAIGRDIAALFAACKLRAGVMRDVRLVVTAENRSPALALIGAKPAVILPKSLLADAPKLRYAMLHELCHLRRRDHAAVMLMALVRSAHWFNPVVHFALARMESDMESACDAAVLSVIEPGEKKNYLVTLLALFTQGRRMALGMAEYRTRRLAQKRLEGAFMRARTGGAAKCAAALLSATLLLCCFTTACQPTPKEEIVVIKEGNYEERKEEDSAAEQIGFTERISGSFQLTDKLSLTVDAALTAYAPLEEYRVYRGVLADFTQEEAEVLAEIFVPGVSMTAYDGAMTKSYILERLLLPAKKDLEEVRAGTWTPDPGLDDPTLTLEDAGRRVEMFQQWYDGAPETIVPAPIDISGYAENGNYFYGEFPVEGSAFCGKFSVGYGARNGTGGMFYYNARYDLVEQHNMMPTPEGAYFDTGARGGGVSMKTTAEEAVRIATEMKDKIGADDLAYAFTVPAVCWSGEMSTGNLNAYWVVFLREIDGVPVLDIGRVRQYAQYDVGQPFEKLVVTVSDEGVLAVNWLGVTHLTGVEVEKPSFLALSRILEAVKNGIAARCAFDAWMEGAIECLEADIPSGRLMYVRLKPPNGGARDVRFLPAWVFDVDVARVWSDGALAENPSLNKRDAYRDILVINALDGSYIDPVYLDGVAY